MIETIWGVRVNKTVIKNFYNANGIKFVKVKAVYARALKNRQALTLERKKFAVVLGNIICAKKTLIHCDETTFTN